MKARISCSAAAVLLAATLGLVAAPAQSATICVDPNKASCEATIQDGIDIAVFGDTVQIAKGVYYENVLIPVAKPGLILKGSRSTILDGDAPLTGVALTVDADSTEVRDFTIRNGQSSGLMLNGDDGIIRGMTITGPESDCIEITGDRAVVFKNDLHGCGSSAVLVGADDVEISNNTISLCDSSCIDVAGDGAIVERNKIHIAADSYLIDVNGDSAEIVNNKLSNADSEAINVSGDDNLVAANKMSNTGGGIAASGQNMRITRNRGENFRGADGISVACVVSCNSARILTNRLEDIGDDAAGLSATATAAGLQISNNRIRNVAGVGMDIGGGIKITAIRNYVTTIGANASTPCYSVSGVGGHDIENNRATDCHGDGIRVSGNDHRIYSNDLRDLLEDGVDVDAGTDVRLTSNTVKDANGVGVEIENSTGTMAVLNRLTDVRLGICDEGVSSVLGTNPTRNAELPDQILSSGPCPID